MKKKWMKDGKFVDISEDEFKDLSTDDMAQYTADKNQSVIDSVKEEFDQKIELAKKEGVSLGDYTSFKEETKEKLDGLDIKEELKEEIHEKHGELADLLKIYGADIKALKETGSNGEQKKEFNSLSRKDQFNYLVRKSMETDEYKEWFGRDCKGATPKMDAAKVTGLVADHTGSIFVTEPVDNVRDIPRMQPHMRDFLSVAPTDESKITFPEVENYSDIYTLGTQMLSENEEVTDVTFDSKENTSSVARLGVSMNVSKRYFRGKSRVIIDHVIAQIPDGLLFKEDVQILHGDGAGSNLSGIITDAREFDLTPSTYAAAAFSSVATYDSGTRALITFAAAHGLLSGDILTIANATAATYNVKHTDILLIDETKVVINLAFVTEADVSAWTGTGTSYWFESVEDAQEFDVLSAAASILEAGLYNANAVFVNGQTTKRVGTLKGNDGHYIGVSRDAAGNLNLDSMPIISIPAIPAGWFLIGDFSAKNIEIREYTTMSVQFLEDVTTKKQNAIVILADEEIHLVKYNPRWYIYDRFSTAKNQLELV